MVAILRKLDLMDRFTGDGMEFTEVKISSSSPPQPRKKKDSTGYFHFLIFPHEILFPKRTFHCRWLKVKVGWMGGIRMPTVAMWPGRIPSGTVIDVPTSQMDVFATLAALLHLPLPADRAIDGVNIMPLLTGKNQSPPHEFLFHYCGDQLHAARYTPKGNAGNVSDHFRLPLFRNKILRYPTMYCVVFVCLFVCLFVCFF